MNSLFKRFSNYLPKQKSGASPAPFPPHNAPALSNTAATQSELQQTLEFTPPAAKDLASTMAESWLAGADPSELGPTMTSAYEQVVWVYRAINVLAEQVANVPFRFSIGKAGGEELIQQGPLVDFYDRPHPLLNRFQYWELRVMWLMLRGECFRIPVYEDPLEPGRPILGRQARNLKLRRVLFLDPAQFQHIIQNNELAGWRYIGRGPNTPLETQIFLPEEVWYEKLPNPLDFWRGLAPLQVASMAARTDFSAGAYMRGLIDNNADSGLVVTTEQQLSPQQREQLLSALRERKRRAGVADRPLLLWHGAQVSQPELTSSDLQFLENRKFTRGEICAAFGVPEEIVTTTDTAKYDVMAGSRLNFIENRVAPLCRRLEAEEAATVRCIDPRAAGWFDLDSLPILQEARKQRLAAARSAFEMGVPFNQLNKVFDLGFKPLPWGDSGFITNSVSRAP